MTDARPSHIAQLLREISWEGNAKPYHQGGRGRENVLTAEVFQALDFLPRKAFLGRVLDSAKGATDAVKLLSREAEHAKVKLLPGDIYLAKKDWFSVQPDLEIISPSVYCLVEVKRIKSSSFQPQQLAREYLTAIQEAHRRGVKPVLLLVLSGAPPVAIRGMGRLGIAAAIAKYLEPVRARCRDHEFAEIEKLIDGVNSVVAYTTWARLREAVSGGTEEFSARRHSLNASVVRVASAALAAIDWHGGDGKKID
jgi:hypothetical protein